MGFISQTPDPPYYAVIFTSVLKEWGVPSYQETANKMGQLVQDVEGFLGVESVRIGKNGITISYWKNKETIEQWKRNLEHQIAQEKGKSIWYESYQVRVVHVEKSYGKFQAL